MRRSALMNADSRFARSGQLHLQQHVEAAAGQLAAQGAQAGSPAALSNTSNSTPSQAFHQPASPLPMTQVIGTCGQARRSVRTSGSTWVTSPSADRRSRQIESRRGGGAHLLEFTVMDAIQRQRAADSHSAMRAGRARLCSTRRGCGKSTPATVRARAAMATGREPVRGKGGRGAAWFVRWRVRRRRCCATTGAAAGWRASAAMRYLWRGEQRVRSFARVRLTAAPARDSACRCPRADRGLLPAQRAGAIAPRSWWSASPACVRFAERAWPRRRRGAVGRRSGALIARFHRAGLDHADLNAHNILLDADGDGWSDRLGQGRACASRPGAGASACWRACSDRCSRMRGACAARSMRVRACAQLARRARHGSCAA